MVSAALTKLGRWDELEKYIATRLEKDPHDPVAIRSRMEVALHKNDLEAGRQQEALLRQSGKLLVGDLNNLAWGGLSSWQSGSESTRNRSGRHSTVAGQPGRGPAAHRRFPLCGGWQGCRGQGGPAPVNRGERPRRA